MAHPTPTPAYSKALASFGDLMRNAEFGAPPQSAEWPLCFQELPGPRVVMKYHFSFSSLCPLLPSWLQVTQALLLRPGLHHIWQKALQPSTPGQIAFEFTFAWYTRPFCVLAVSSFFIPILSSPFYKNFKWIFTQIECSQPSLWVEVSTSLRLMFCALSPKPGMYTEWVAYIHVYSA
jgi:hypothetical protein